MILAFEDLKVGLLNNLLGSIDHFTDCGVMQTEMLSYLCKRITVVHMRQRDAMITLLSSHLMHTAEHHT